MRKIVFATGNRHKLQEAGEILGDGFEIVSAAEAGITEEIPETGSTLQANSRQKAGYLWDRLGLSCFADDTGLEIEALDGAPGVYSARYAGEGHDFAANTAKLLKEMEGKENRRARFRTVVALIMDGRTSVFEGEVHGRIATEPSGAGGFGYDPVFIPDELASEDGTVSENTAGLTFSEMTEEQKNAISHRGRAMRALAEYLRRKDAM